MKPHTIKLIAWFLMALNLLLAVAITFVEPSKWITIPAGGLLMPVMLFLVLAVYRSRGCTNEALIEIYDNLNFASLMITLALGITFTNITGFTSGDIGQRMTGAMLGLLIVFFGNRAPKQKADRCLISGDAARVQKVTRRIGYIMVISGLLMSGSWIVLEAKIASLVFIAIGLLMILTVLLVAFVKQRPSVAA